MKDVAVCECFPRDGLGPAKGGEEACTAREEAASRVRAANPAEACPTAAPAACERGAEADPKQPQPASDSLGPPQPAELRMGGPSGAALSVDFSVPVPQASLHVAGRPLLSGPWQALVRIDGMVKPAAGPWSEVCRHRSAQCDYLELAQPLEDGWRLTRQMLLAERDQFLLVADGVLGPPSARATIEYQLRWPLAPGVSCAWARENWEGWLVDGRQRQASILPLELPEWRAAWEDAALETADGALRLAQRVRGGALYAPLWLDLARGRLRQALTWRRLTVGENLSVVSRDEAVGYRVQVGRQQWLIYHSLAPVGNRSVLGLNTCAAFVCGRFLPEGKIEEIVVIQ